jgi:hypothetical protein
MPKYLLRAWPGALSTSPPGMTKVRNHCGPLAREQNELETLNANEPETLNANEPERLKANEPET